MKKVSGTNLTIESPVAPIMLDSDSSEENTPVKKTNPNRRRRGLASRLLNSGVSNDLTAQEAAIYSTQVNKCFSSKSGSIPLNQDLIANQVSNGSDVEEETGSILSCKQRKLSLRQTRHVDDDILILDEDCLIPCTPPNTTSPAVQLKSPSPPPQPPSPPRAMLHLREQTRRQPRMTKAVKKALSNLSQTKTQLHVNSFQESELNTSDVVICTEADDRLTLKVRHGTDTHRLPVMENDFFKAILANLSQKLDVAESQILLIHNDVTISGEDTPRSLGLTTADIIDCHVNRDEWTTPATDFNDSLNDTNCITLYIQSRNDRHKMEFKLDKTSPLDGLVRQYATKTDKDPSKLRLLFDGENLDLRDSADNLEIEDGYTLDLISR